MLLSMLPPHLSVAVGVIKLKKIKLESTGYSALPSPPRRLMRRTNTQHDAELSVIIAGNKVIIAVTNVTTLPY